jgi:hypothetical protein
MATDGVYGRISFTIKSPVTSARLFMDRVHEGGFSLTLLKLERCVIFICIEAIFTELK